jgi:putative membrane protein
MLRIILAVAHLVALVMGMSSIDMRARSLRRLRTEPNALRNAFTADTMWGIAAALWISTGLWRWFAGTEKSPAYYPNNHIFLAKMGFLLLILLLEIWPMVTLIRWRIAAKNGTLPPMDQLAETGGKLAIVSRVQALLVFAMLIAAVMMARGYGFRG